MHPSFIKAELQLKGFRMRTLAKRLHVTDSSVWRVVHGEARSRRIAKEISRITGIPVSQLWPQRYPEIELAEIRAGRSAA